MRVLICAPVTSLHTPDDIRDWITELAAMREQHRDDHEALACIARAEWHAASMLELSATLPRRAFRARPSAVAGRLLHGVQEWVIEVVEHAATIARAAAASFQRPRNRIGSKIGLFVRLVVARVYRSHALCYLFGLP
jgi:hypothetical protein